jgi:hypothetical protein
MGEMHVFPATPFVHSEIREQAQKQEQGPFNVLTDSHSDSHVCQIFPCRKLTLQAQKGKLGFYFRY